MAPGSFLDHLLCSQCLWSNSAHSLAGSIDMHVSVFVTKHELMVCDRQSLHVSLSTAHAWPAESDACKLLCDSQNHQLRAAALGGSRYDR